MKTGAVRLTRGADFPIGVLGDEAELAYEGDRDSFTSFGVVPIAGGASRTLHNQPNKGPAPSFAIQVRNGVAWIFEGIRPNDDTSVLKRYAPPARDPQIVATQSALELLIPSKDWFLATDALTDAQIDRTATAEVIAIQASSGAVLHLGARVVLSPPSAGPWGFARGLNPTDPCHFSFAVVTATMALGAWCPAGGEPSRTLLRIDLTQGTVAVLRRGIQEVRFASDLALVAYSDLNGQWFAAKVEGSIPDVEHEVRFETTEPILAVHVLPRRRVLYIKKSDPTGSEPSCGEQRCPPGELDVASWPKMKPVPLIAGVDGTFPLFSNDSSNDDRTPTSEVAGAVAFVRLLDADHTLALISTSTPAAQPLMSAPNGRVVLEGPFSPEGLTAQWIAGDDVAHFQPIDGSGPAATAPGPTAAIWHHVDPKKVLLFNYPAGPPSIGIRDALGNVYPESADLVSLSPGGGGSAETIATFATPIALTLQRRSAVALAIPRGDNRGLWVAPLH